MEAQVEYALRILEVMIYMIGVGFIVSATMCENVQLMKNDLAHASSMRGGKS
jgi:hypothetical protein